MKLTKAQIKKIEEETAFSVEETSEGYELSWYTDAGEDYSFYVTKDNPIEEIKSFCEDFDPEEHAVNWYGESGAPGLRALLDDADRIAEEQDKLCEIVSNF